MEEERRPARGGGATADPWRWSGGRPVEVERRPARGGGAVAGPSVTLIEQDLGRWSVGAGASGGRLWGWSGFRRSLWGWSGGQPVGHLEQRKILLVERRPARGCEAAAEPWGGGAPGGSLWRCSGSRPVSVETVLVSKRRMQRRPATAGFPLGRKARGKGILSIESLRLWAV